MSFKLSKISLVASILPLVNYSRYSWWVQKLVLVGLVLLLFVLFDNTKHPSVI